jgi:hypothetical protein
MLSTEDIFYNGALKEKTKFCNISEQIVIILTLCSGANIGKYKRKCRFSDLLRTHRIPSAFNFTKETFYTHKNV